MLPVLISALAALGLALLRLWGCHRQMAEMARVLEETPAESNLRLTMEVNSATARRLCRAMNARLDGRPASPVGGAGGALPPAGGGRDCA